MANPQNRTWKDLELRALGVGNHTIERGLIMQARKGAGGRIVKSWACAFSFDGRRRFKGLGAYPETTLVEAREKANAIRALVRNGVDPIAAEKTAKAERIAADKQAAPFRQALDEYLTTRPDWSADHVKRLRQRFALHASRILDQSCAALDFETVVEILRPLWHSKRATAARLRADMSGAWEYAQAMGYVASSAANPAALNVRFKAALGPQKRKRHAKNHPAIAPKEAPAFQAMLCAKASVSARAMRFVMLNAPRANEALRAKWREFDLDGPRPSWDIPGARMKAREDHRIPLASQSVELLRQQREACGDASLDAYVWPSPKNPRKPLSASGLRDLVALMGFRGRHTPHGSRSTMRTWIEDETQFDWRLAEHALAHKIGNEAERAYNRGRMFEKRRELMQAWADYVEPRDAIEGANVVVAFPAAAK